MNGVNCNQVACFSALEFHQFCADEGLSKSLDEEELIKSPLVRSITVVAALLLSEPSFWTNRPRKAPCLCCWLLLAGQTRPRRELPTCSRDKTGSQRRCSHNAFSMISVIYFARSIRVGGVLGLKTRRLERVCLTVCLLHSAALAVFMIDMPQLVLEQIS